MLSSRNQSRCHILSVTADEGEYALLDVALRGLSVFRLERAATVEEALALLRDRPALTRPNLLVLSSRLGTETRKELLGALKSNRDTKALPVVVFSSTLEAEEVNGLYDAGAACVVQAPEVLAEYADVIRVFKVLWVQYARLPFSESMPHMEDGA
jgi:CheY-like chemotaxis protein